jgi:hypothetical protein
MASYYPSYDLVGRITPTKLDTGIPNMPAARLGRMDDAQGPSFSSILTGAIDKTNTELNAPDIA